jgi:bacteriocin-type signal sequence
MTTPKKDKDKPTSTPKKSAGIKAEIDKGKAELTDDELKKVTGGVQPRKLTFESGSNPGRQRSSGRGAGYQASDSIR